MRGNARNVHDAGEWAKAGPGCPFTTSVDTMELAVNDPGRCVVEANWLTLERDLLTSR
jgi:hypothetical protein